MRLSVLLPTKNGGEFLPACLAAVLGQDVDLELVVADNANTDATAGLLAECADERLTVVRHDRPVDVTQNWTSALAASTGDYLMVLGDDDLLLPGAVARIYELLEQAGRPDCLLYNAYSYVFPGAMAGLEVSHYADPHFEFGAEFTPYGDVPPALRQDLVRDLFRFRVRLPINMQTTVFSRVATERIRGQVFPPPFPDHYALGSMLLTAPRWWFAPEQLVVIGVTPKSFGHFVYSDDQAAGLAYLGIDADFPGRVPGNALIDAMHLWLQMLLDGYPALLPGVHISRGDYLLRQIWSWVVAVRGGVLSARDAAKLLRRLSPADREYALKALLTAPDLWQKAARRLSPTRGRAEARWHGLRALPEVQDIAGFGAWVVQQKPAQ